MKEPLPSLIITLKKAVKKPICRICKLEIALDEPMLVLNIRSRNSTYSIHSDSNNCDYWRVNAKELIVSKRKRATRLFKVYKTYRNEIATSATKTTTE